ncbi:MAG: MoaD/ThiS family protein [Candidatus Aenigmarchaeota archaeon]|nr:MoaD/ThiS family protein [Candidatus Aenigmarchaeota archaeon]
MKIKIVLGGKKKEVEVKNGENIIELAKRNNIILSNYIVKVNGKIVPENQVIKRYDKIEFIRIASGG